MIQKTKKTIRKKFSNFPSRSNFPAASNFPEYSNFPGTPPTTGGGGRRRRDFWHEFLHLQGWDCKCN